MRRYNPTPNAGIAQLVERNLAKVEVASSRLVSRSRNTEGSCGFPFLFCRSHTSADGPLESARHAGGVAEWPCSGLQIRVRRFDSDPRLQVPLSRWCTVV